MAKTVDKYQKMTYYNLPENYHYYEDADVTKFDSLTGDEIDGNFFVLEGRDIESIDVSEDRKRMIINLVNGAQIESDNIFGEYIESLSFDYDKEDGILTVCVNDCDHEPIKVEGFLTLKDVAEMIEDFRIYTDDTIIGDGTIDSPLSIANSQKSGMIKPVKDIVSALPSEPTVGDRYITLETMNANGRYYTFDGLLYIIKALEKEGNGWRVATKTDWAEMLNYMEKPIYRDHNSKAASKWLGSQAGSKLKNSKEFGLKYCGYVFNSKSDDEEGGYEFVSYNGTRASFWCASSTMGRPLTDEDTQAWVKQFYIEGPRSGQVYQTIVDNAILSSIRLVKDIEGGDTVGATKILGTVYPVSAMKSADGKNKMWTTVNLDYETENEYDSYKQDDPITVTEPFVNEWDGENWIKYKLENYTTFMVTSEDSLYSDELCYIKDGDVIPVNESTVERVATLESEVESMMELIAKYHTSVSVKLEDAIAYQYEDGYVYKGGFTLGEGRIDYTISQENIGEGGVNIMNDFARFLGALYRTHNIEPIQFKYKYYDWDDEGTLKGSNYKLAGEPINTEGENKNTLVGAIVAAYQADPTQTFKVKFDDTVIAVAISIM